VRAHEERNYLRPPGALQDEAAFVSACIGCGLCGEVCPPRCIRFHDRDGGDKVNTPYINPEEKACILCDKCMEVCPTEALTKIPRFEIDMGIAQIDRTACYPWVDRGICGACVSICPLGERAISFKMWYQYQPIVKQACVGCGLCVEVCPHPSLPIWIVERSKGTVARHTA
jgi:ferredoxin-type protein NapG